MTVREIARSAAGLLQADDITAALEEAGNAPLADADTKTLVDCVLLAAAELGSDGFPLCVTERLSATGGFIPLACFSAPPSLVRAVTRNGVAVEFGLDSRGISVARDGEYDVTYTRVPTSAALDGNVELGALADGTLVTFLAARDYCLVTGRTDDAAIWDQRYTDEAAKKRLSVRRRMPARVWR